MLLATLRNLNSIYKDACGLLILDKGFAFVINIATFLLSVFLVSKYNGVPLEELSKDKQFALSFFGIAVIQVLNFSAILYRLFLLKKGIKHSLLSCYRQALKRLPMLFLLNILASIIVIFLAITFSSILRSLQGYIQASMWFVVGKASVFLMLFVIFFTMPYLLCVHVIAEERSALQAFIDTLRIVRHKISGAVLAIVSLMYSVLSFVMLALDTAFLGPVFSLFVSLCFIYCHAVSIVLFDRVSIDTKAEKNGNIAKLTT